MQQNIRLALHKRCWTIEHLRHVLIGIHRHIIRVDCQRHRIDGADCVDGADVVDMPMRVDDILGNELILLDVPYDALRLVARVDNDRFKRLGAGGQVTVLLKDADGHTYDNRHLLFVLFGHASLFLPLTLTVRLRYIIAQWFLEVSLPLLTAWRGLVRSSLFAEVRRFLWKSVGTCCQPER